MKHIINKLYYKTCLNKSITCIGDSHTEIFNYINSEVLLPGHFFNTLVVHGATCSGIDNPNSKTNTMGIFEQYIKNHNLKNETVLVQLGEVDCGFVIWYRAQKYGISTKEQLVITLQKYQKFIDQLAIESKRVIVMSAVPPTIVDGQAFGEVANKRKEILATRKERTYLTREFNLKMHGFCSENKYFFMNLDPILIDVHTGVIKKEYLNEDPLDHHLNNRSLAPIVLEATANLNIF